jgi:hypothetical protein
VYVPKTKPTKVSAESHIAAIANDEQRNDEASWLLHQATRQRRSEGPRDVGSTIGSKSEAALSASQ